MKTELAQLLQQIPWNSLEELPATTAAKVSRGLAALVEQAIQNGELDHPLREALEAASAVVEALRPFESLQPAGMLPRPQGSLEARSSLLHLGRVARLRARAAGCPIEALMPRTAAS